MGCLTFATLIDHYYSPFANFEGQNWQRRCDDNGHEGGGKGVVHVVLSLLSDYVSCFLFLYMHMRFEGAMVVCPLLSFVFYV